MVNNGNRRAYVLLFFAIVHILTLFLYPHIFKLFIFIWVGTFSKKMCCMCTIKKK